MKTFKNLIIILLATLLIVSCSKPQNVVVEPQPTDLQTQKTEKTKLTQQRAEQAFSELDDETNETQPPKPEKTKPDAQDKTTPKESESSSAKSDFPTKLPPLTPQQKSEGWVDATGEYHQGPNMTAAEAQRLALEKAKRNAIEQVLGEEIQAQEMLLRFGNQKEFHQSFTTLSQATLFGRIIEQKAPVWAPVENVQFSPGEPPIPLYRVFLRTKVAKEKGKSDKTFQVKLKLNDGKVTFLEGDEMILHLTLTKDCYITVFNVLSDGTVLVLFSPQGFGQQVARAGKIMSIPSEAERSQGVHFRVGLLPGKTQDTEYVWVVVTKDDIPFLPKEAKEFSPDIPALKGKVVLPTYQSALEEINRWLVSIPLNQRAVDMQQYEIRKK